MIVEGHSDDALARLRASFNPTTRERIDVIEKIKARFLTTERYTQLECAFEAVLIPLLLRLDDTRPLEPGNRHEGRIVLAIGEAGAGKSTAIHRLLDRHPTYTGYARTGKDRNTAAIRVKVRAPSTFLGVGRQLLAATGYPLKGRLERHVVWQRIAERLPMLGTTVLHFDEMHNVIDNANHADKADIQHVLKSLVADAAWPVSIIVSGLPRIVDLIEASSEDERRTEAVEFTPLVLPDEADMLAAVTSELAAMAGLRVSSNMHVVVTPRLAHAASQQLGNAMVIIQSAVLHALKKNEQSLSIHSYGLAYAARTGCGPAANPFIVDDWRAVQPARLLKKDTLPEARQIENGRSRQPKGPRQ